MKIASVSTAVLFTICLMVSTACGADGEGGAQTPTQGEEPVIRGQVTFHPGETMFYGGLGDSCEVTGYYSYIRAGAQVVVEDAAQTIIASGALEPGITVEGDYLGSPRACRFAFAVERVPTSDFYTIGIGDGRWDALSTSYHELESQNWTVDLDVQEYLRGEQPVLRGQVTFHPRERMFYGGLGDACEVTGQYDYIRAGAQVVVKDAAGTIIASDALEPGITVEGGLGLPRPCRFVFAVEGVPTSDFYTIEVGDGSTHALGLSYDEIESQNWTVDLSVWE